MAVKAIIGALIPSFLNTTRQLSQLFSSDNQASIAMSSSLFVFSLSILALFAWAQAILPSTHPQVLDVEGIALQSGVDYYLISAHSGGLSLGRREDRSPFTVLQHSNDGRYGKRIRFSPTSSCSPADGVIRQSLLRSWVGDEESLRDSKRTIHESTDLNIGFSNVPLVWQMGRPDEEGRRYVTVGGRAGHPGPSTLSNWFKIEGAGVHGQHHTYILAHCPSVCEKCKSTCSGLGISTEGGRRWLSASGHPLRVMFVKAEDS